MNLAKVYAGDPTGYGPCTAEAVIEMLDYAGVDLKGKRAVVIGRSLVIGKPVAMMLMKKNATVTVCHTKTVDMPGVCKGAGGACCGSRRLQRWLTNHLFADVQL